MARGLQFELPWPAEPPKNRDLRLFVRFTTPDGKKITTDAPIRNSRTVDRGPRRKPAPDRPKKSETEATRRPPRDNTPKSRLKSPRSAANDTDEPEPADEEPRRSTSPVEIAGDDDGDDRPVERQPQRTAGTPSGSRIAEPSAG